MNMGVLGGAQGMVGAQVGVGIAAQNHGMGGAGMGMGVGGQGMGLGASQTISIGEADSTLRFALG
jgi:hypothetical protein